MINQSIKLQTTFVLSDDEVKRYEITKQFLDSKGSKALLILLNASNNANLQQTDMTTNLTINNLSLMGFSTITIWNVFPQLTQKINAKQLILDDENFQHLETLIRKEYDTIIIGWGSSFQNNKTVIEAKSKVYNFLKDHENKVFQIVDKNGIYRGKNIHPLFAGNYFSGEWQLENFPIPKDQGTKSAENCENQKEDEATRKEGEKPKNERKAKKEKGWKEMFEEHEKEVNPQSKA